LLVNNGELIQSGPLPVDRVVSFVNPSRIDPEINEPPSTRITR
jgi:hypothetical protein